MTYEAVTRGRDFDECWQLRVRAVESQNPKPVTECVERVMSYHALDYCERSEDTSDFEGTFKLTVRPRET